MASNVEIVITAVDKTKGTFKNIGGSLGKIGGLALKGAAVGIGLAATAVAGLGVASAKLAIAAAPIKGVQDAFYGLADAAGMGGDKMLKALQEGGVGMVNNENLMKSFNKAAMLVSEDFAVKLPDAMGYLSKVSAATGQDMGFMMDSLVTGVGRLSPMILDNLGIQVKLSDATERAAEMFGVEASALEQTQIQAGMMDVVLEKLKTNTAAMPEVAGSAAQGMAALGVQFDNVKAEIGLALLPIFQKIMTALGEFAEVVMPVVVEYIKTSFIPALERIWEWMSTVLIPFLQDVVFPWIQEYLPQALQILSDFWTNVLKPAIEVVWKWMVDVLMPFLRDVVFPWLKEYIPKALQVLSDFWTGVLKPAITIVWNWMSTVLMPFLQNIVFPWLQEHIPQALQTLSDFWENTLKPAIETVWDFIKTYLVPIFEVVVEIVGITLTLAIEVLQKAWELLLPVLNDVWDFVEKYITPALTLSLIHI